MAHSALIEHLQKGAAAGYPGAKQKLAFALQRQETETISETATEAGGRPAQRIFRHQPEGEGVPLFTDRPVAGRGDVRPEFRERYGGAVPKTLFQRPAQVPLSTEQHRTLLRKRGVDPKKIEETLGKPEKTPTQPKEVQIYEWYKNQTKRVQDAFDEFTKKQKGKEKESIESLLGIGGKKEDEGIVEKLKSIIFGKDTETPSEPVSPEIQVPSTEAGEGRQLTADMARKYRQKYGSKKAAIEAAKKDGWIF